MIRYCDIYDLVSGDDNSDEPMFEALNALQASEENSPRNTSKENQTVFGVTVGKKPTAAGGILDGPLISLDAR